MIDSDRPSCHCHAAIDVTRLVTRHSPHATQNPLGDWGRIRACETKHFASYQVQYHFGCVWECVLYEGQSTSGGGTLTYMMSCIMSTTVMVENEGPWAKQAHVYSTSQWSKFGGWVALLSC